MLQCVAVRCSALQCVAVLYSHIVITGIHTLYLHITHVHVKIRISTRSLQFEKHCNTNTLQRTVTHYNALTLQALQHSVTHCKKQHSPTTPCLTLQLTATLCNSMQCTASHCNALQHTATHCKTLQHTATYCNTGGSTRPFLFEMHYKDSELGARRYVCQRNGCESVDARGV